MFYNQRSDSYTSHLIQDCIYIFILDFIIIYEITSDLVNPSKQKYLLSKEFINQEQIILTTIYSVWSKNNLI